VKDKLFILFQYIVPQHLLSRAVGRLAECTNSRIKNWIIQRFIKQFNVDMSEAERQQPEQFINFNDFFTRALKEGARPIAEGEDVVVSPADGAISEMGTLQYGRILQAKGHSYSAVSLLGGCTERAKPFINGEFATIYLSPKDYHRVHMPVAGALKEAYYVPGDLFSVNQTTANNVDSLFARNERLVCLFETERGPMAMVLVGAMIVAGIETVWSGQVAPLKKEAMKLFSTEADAPLLLEKGAEMGRFKLGSTVILLYPEGVINWRDHLAAGAPVKMGEVIAHQTES